MEVAIDQIADVVAVRNHGVAAVLSVGVPAGMFVAEVLGRALVGMGCVNRKHMFDDVGALDVMQVTAVQEVVVVLVSDELVLTIEAVHVFMDVDHVVLRSPPISRAWARPTRTRSVTCSSASE